MIFQKWMHVLLNVICNTYQFIAYIFSSDHVWSALSAIGTIGAVIFSVVIVIQENKYRTKHKLKIKISSTMGILSPYEKNYYTELTNLSFEIISTTNRILDDYTVSLELKPTYINKIVSLAQENTEMPIIGDYEYVVDPNLLKLKKGNVIKYKFNSQSIEPSTPLNVFFDLRNQSFENDNIGWSLKSSVDQGYFSGKIRIKLIDKFGNYYYSSWHKMKHPKKYKNKKYLLPKKAGVKKVLNNCLYKINKNKNQKYIKEFYRKRNQNK